MTWSLRTTERDLDTERDEVLMFAATWMTLGDIKSQTQKAAYQMIQTTWNVQNPETKPQRQDTGQWLSEAGGKGKWGATASGYVVSFQGDEMF